MSDQDAPIFVESGAPQSGRVLDPLERSSEIIDGLALIAFEALSCGRS